MTKKIASRLLKTIILAIFVFPSIHPGRMGINILFMNTNVDLFHDSTKNSSEILTSESNEIGSLKIIMPDKLNQLTARSSYICHIDDFVKGNKDYYGFDIQSDSEMEYDYELIINKIKHINKHLTSKVVKILTKPHLLLMLFLRRSAITYAIAW